MSRIYLPPYLWVPPLGWEDPLEEGMATHSNILAWKTPCTEEPGRIQSRGLQRVRHDWATSLFFFWLSSSTDLPSSLEQSNPDILPQRLFTVCTAPCLHPPSLPSDFLLTPCYTGRLAILGLITTCTFPQAFALAVYMLGMRASLPLQVATCPVPHFFRRSLLKVRLISVLDHFHFVTLNTSYLMLSQWAYLFT